jgi:hypothetical protein
MAFKLSPDEGTRISKSEAMRWTENYKGKNPDSPWAQFYGAKRINEILEQKDCVGIRIYITQNNDGATRLVLVGARADGTNIWPDGMTENALDDGVIIEFGSLCPPFCAPNE